MGLQLISPSASPLRVVALLKSEEPEASVLDEARARHMRRELENAVDQGTSLLAALNLPRLVDVDFVPFDPVAIGEAVDSAIAALNHLDAPDDDLEDDDREYDTADDEPSIGRPEDFTAKLDGDIAADPDTEVDDADLEHDGRDGEPLLWVFGPSRREAAHV